jgi:DNA-binding NarL/FixJ family response regulator
MKVWLQRIESGAPSSLSRAPTLRREERWLAEAIEQQTFCDTVDQRAQVTVAVSAASKTMTEAVGELVTAAGGILVNCVIGKPAIEDTTDVILWDLYDSPESQIEWIRLLASHKPNRLIALLCSFPRGDSAQAAMEAGAIAVLGRPTDCEAIRGVLFMAKTALLAAS